MIFRQLIPNCEDKSFYNLIIWDRELFLCCEIPYTERKNKGFLFPAIVYENGVCLPDIFNFEEERKYFYKSRLSNSNLFILRYRYLSYLIEFSLKKERYQFAKIFCNEVGQFLINRKLSFDYKIMFERLIEVSLRFNLMDSLKNTKSLIYKMICEVSVEYISVISKENEFDCDILYLSEILYMFKNKLGLLIDPTTKDMLILKLESYKKMSELCSKEPFLSELLKWAHYYNNNVAKRVKEYGKYYEELAESQDMLLFKIAQYELALKLYRDNGLKDEAACMKVKVKKTHRELAESNQVQPISLSLEIPREFNEQMEQIFIAFTEDLTPANINYCVLRLTHDIFMPPINLTDAKVKLNNANFVSILTTLNVSSNGKSIFITNNAEDWEKYYIADVYKVTLDYLFQTFRRIWYAFINAGMDANSIYQIIQARDFISSDQKEILKCGIDRMFAEDYISTLHIIVPQFEGAFRRFFEYYGFPTTNVAFDITQKEQTFNEFIENDFVRSLPSKYLYMIRFIMIDKLGLNLRNEIAHGLIELRSINQMHAFMVMHLLIVLFTLELTVKNESALDE
jgi:hypothetical protein